MQYSIQGLNCDDAERKDLLMDIGTEELSHLEIVGALARLHLKPMKSDRDSAEADPLIAIAGGGGVSLCNSMGNAWTADYLKITGELDVDLRSNIAAEARAKIVYERLINFTNDAGTRDALQFLMTTSVRAPSRRDQGTSRVIERAFGLIGTPPKAKVCRGMEGLIEESSEVIEEGQELEDVASDLALIAASQKVEHSAYGTARTMAGQVGLPAEAALLSKSLAGEDVADSLLTQLARELMSQARTGSTKQPKHASALARAD
jgi:ferritin-like metal-binding protein YciE